MNIENQKDYSSDGNILKLREIKCFIDLSHRDTGHGSIFGKPDIVRVHFLNLIG